MKANHLRIDTAFGSTEQSIMWQLAIYEDRGEAWRPPWPRMQAACDRLYLAGFIQPDLWGYYTLTDAGHAELERVMEAQLASGQVWICGR